MCFFKASNFQPFYVHLQPRKNELLLCFFRFCIQLSPSAFRYGFQNIDFSANFVLFFDCPRLVFNLFPLKLTFRSCGGSKCAIVGERLIVKTPSHSAPQKQILELFFCFRVFLGLNIELEVFNLVCRF